jgi:hypothetical protein
MLRRLSVVALGVFLAGCHGIEPGPASPSLTSSGSGAAPTAIVIVISPGELPMVAARRTSSSARRPAVDLWSRHWCPYT